MNGNGKKGFLAIAMFLSLHTFAAESIEVEDGDTVDITISKKEVTRISIFGSGRISRVRGAEGVVEVTTDKEDGDIFIRPKTDKSTFSFFVRDNYGNSYTLLAHTQILPSQTIMLKPKKTTGMQNTAAEKRFKEMPLEDKTKVLVKAMALDEELGGYDIYAEEKPLEIKRWKEVLFVLMKTYEGAELKGEVFLLRNETKLKMEFHENEFLDVGKGVVASAMAKMSLDPAESTFVYVVKRNVR